MHVPLSIWQDRRRSGFLPCRVPLKCLGSPVLYFAEGRLLHSAILHFSRAGVCDVTISDLVFLGVDVGGSGFRVVLVGPGGKGFARRQRAAVDRSHEVGSLDAPWFALQAVCLSIERP